MKYFEFGKENEELMVLLHGGVSEFVREYTTASGGPYCDCGYRRKD